MMNLNNNQENLLITLLLLLVLNFILYSCISYVQLDFNMLSWNKDTRASFVSISGSLTFIGIIGTYITWNRY